MKTASRNQPPAWLNALAGALDALQADCRQLQDFDDAHGLIGLSDAEIERRQMLDRITQEADELARFATAISNSEPWESALAKVRLEALRTRLTGVSEPLAAEDGEPELF